MTTNAAYCKTYRKRIYNFEDRIQQTTTSTPSLQHDCNMNAAAEMMSNEVNDFFDKMNDINSSQIEQSFSINNDDSISGQDETSLYSFRFTTTSLLFIDIFHLYSKK